MSRLSFICRPLSCWCAGALAQRTPQKDAAPPSWKEWEGRVIDRQFRLDRHLGGGTQSAVFLTRYGREAQQLAAIKVLLADSIDRGALLTRWERAAELSHPGLVRLFAMGHCESEGIALLYLVMEYGEENLADVLQQRALTLGETREMLEPVLDALGYVHSRGLVHGRIKPSNILAVSDRLKISSDCLHPEGEPNQAPAHPSVYDPPEGKAGFVSPAGDVWTVGITLVEALTQHPLLPKRPQHKPPSLPVTLPPLFLEIAQQCLQPDPQRRESAAHLADRLRRAPAALEAPAPVPGRSFRVWRYAMAAVALGIGLSGTLVLPTHRNMAPAPVPVPTPAPAVQPAAAAVVPPAPIPRHATEQPLPDVSRKARSSIQGMIEVGVRVHVDPSGSVVDARLDTSGPSRYFASRTLDAARRWKFDPLPAETQGDSDEWLLRFDYTSEGTQAAGEHVTESLDAAATAPASAGEQRPRRGGEQRLYTSPKPKLTIPAGTEFRVRLAETLDTKRVRAGARFSATLEAPIMVRGRIVVPKGTLFEGHVIEAKASSRLRGRGVFALALDSFRLRGTTYRVQTSALITGKRNVKLPVEMPLVFSLRDNANAGEGLL